MARKRLPRRTNDIPPRIIKHVPGAGENINGSVTSTVRILLLLLIGLGICAFLFYPDITRLVRILQNGDDNAALRAEIKHLKERADRDETDSRRHGHEYDTKVRHQKNDLLEGEEGEEGDEGDEDGDGEEDGHTEVEDGDMELHEFDEYDETSDHDVDKKQEQELEDTASLKSQDNENIMNSKTQGKLNVDKDGSSFSKSVPDDTEKLLKFSTDDSKPQVMEVNLNDVKKEVKTPKRTQKTERKGSPSKKTKDDDSSSLPTEVRNFKARILNTVTAKKIFVDGRRLPPIELLPQKETNSSVKVFLFDEFLSTEECDGLMKAHDKHVQEANKLDPILCFDSTTTLNEHLKVAKKKIKVTPNVFTKGTRCVNATFSRQLSDWMHKNWSYSTAFYPGESKFSSIFANRVKSAMGLDQENGGKFQLTSYPKGKAYKSHTDCVVDGQDKRDRVATVMVYLQDVEEGGETRFPELGIWVKPRKGRAIVWNNMNPDGDCEAHSIHTASKVMKGNKYILLRWYYYKNFYSLGKRPPDAPLPHRQPGTPRVSCDEFKFGSCRWYDEWSYDHLLDYEREKLTRI